MVKRFALTRRKSFNFQLTLPENCLLCGHFNVAPDNKLGRLASFKPSFTLSPWIQKITGGNLKRQQSWFSACGSTYCSFRHHLYHHCSSYLLTYILTKHLAILSINTSAELKQRQSYWKFNSCLLSNVNFCHNLKSLSDSKTLFTSADSESLSLLKKALSMFHSWSKLLQ